MNIFSELKRRLSYRTFSGSKKYWISRYANGGNSGAGSDGRLQEFKAKYINTFIKNHNINSVLDMGSGDGSFAKRVTAPNYYGYDISPDAIARCNELINQGVIHSNYEFGHEPPISDLALSLDVIYHLTEDDTYEAYLDKLFLNSRKYVIIYGYEHIDKKLWPHVKPREFTRDIQHRFMDWELVGMHHPPYAWDNKNKAHTTKSRFFIYKYDN